MDLQQQQWVDQQAELSEYEILDVRTLEEFEAGHIPNATLLDINDPPNFMSGLNARNKDKTYFVYCRSGARSARACQVMEQFGFKTTFNLLGGIMEWQGPVE
ncbi:MAG: rhodanese-like domain-containing protein [Flavobacteriaceae bacterium]